MPNNGYTDIRLDGITVHSEVLAADENTFYVSNWNGRMFRVDWPSGKVTTSPSASEMAGAVGGTLKSLCVSPHGDLVAAATMAPWAVVWDQQSGQIEKVYSENGLPVSSVCFSPDGRFLLLGTGRYSLRDSRPTEARLEIWCEGDEWFPYGFVALPGASVDWLGREHDSVVAITGRARQDGGYVCFLRDKDYRCLRVSELGCFYPYVCGLDPRRTGVMTFGQTLIFFPPEGAVRSYPKPAPGLDLKGSCLCDTGILTVRGELISLKNSQVVGNLPPLPDCFCVAPRSDAGYLGISANGVLRVWDGE